MPSLDVWYQFLADSGVNETWCSIGTVIVASLMVITILRVFLKIIGVSKR